MRQFKRRSLADFLSWRNAVNNCSLCRAYICLGKRLPFISFKVNLGNKSLAGAPESSFSFNIYKGFSRLVKNSAFKVFLHCFADGLNALCFIAVAKVNLRQNQVQRTWLCACRFCSLFPVITVLCILITGNNRPAFQINIFWQKNFWHTKSKFTNTFHRPNYTALEQDML